MPPAGLSAACACLTCTCDMPVGVPAHYGNFRSAQSFGFDIGQTMKELTHDGNGHRRL